MPLAAYTFVPLRGPFPPWLSIVIGVVLVIAAAVATKPPRRAGFGTASGYVVEHRPGRRPTVVEFQPPGADRPVRFKHGDEVAMGEKVPVSYSLADPRNAAVVKEDQAERAARPVVGVVALIIGLVLLVAGILAYV